MSYELVIIGAGLTGLRAVTIANELGINDVLVVDYEKNKGGFGSSLFHLAGFQKENDLIEKSNHVSYEFWYQSTVVGLFVGEDSKNHQISVQTPSGTKDIEARRVILSSGSLEKPREMHKISGSRPAGVMTPLMALGLLERGYLPGTACVVIENSKRAKAVADLLDERGCHVHRVRGESSEVTHIKGKSRITEVEILDLNTRESHCLSCDTLVFSEGIIPCTFYLQGTAIDLDEHRFVIVDGKGRTNVPGIIALGSCTNQMTRLDAFSEATAAAIQSLLNA